MDRAAGMPEHYIVMAPAPSFLCPSCQSGDLITIQMTVSETELSFSTCHECEAKWWHRDGEPVELTSILGLVGTK